MMEVLRLCSHCPLRRDPFADVRGIDCPRGCKHAHEEYPPFTCDWGDVRAIHLAGSPILRERALHLTQTEVESPSLEILVRRLFATMRMAGGVGLAAPQIGIPLRVAVVETHGVSWTLINPEITSVSDDEEVAEEGCLSIPGVFGKVRRPRTIGVRSMTNDVPFGATGPVARAVLHEIDHLNGVLFIDRLVDQALRILPVPTAMPAVLWPNPEYIGCPGCGATYARPVTDVDIEVICSRVIDGCKSPILKLKGTGTEPWWTKFKPQMRRRATVDQQLRNRWLS